MDATVSIGVAEALGQDCNIERMLARADTALYAAKQSGRNRVVCADAADAPPPADDDLSPPADLSRAA